jgi:hypothetical protein
VLNLGVLPAVALALGVLTWQAWRGRVARQALG